MKMKVAWTGNLQKDSRNTTTPLMTEDCEWVFNNILRPYFLQAASHNSGIDQPFTANFYCSHPYPPYGTEIEIPSSMGYGGTFTDSAVRRPTWISMRSPNIRLSYHSKFIGVLCPETQTLWATDWTHDNNIRYYRSVTQYIISYLYSQGLIRLVEPSPVKNKQIKKTIFTVSMGCDPEFELISAQDGKVLDAYETTNFDIRNSHGNVGVDGSGDQIELRPEPGPPEEVVKNIRGLLETFSDRYSENFRLAASSDEFPCGGHIHIGVKPKPEENYFSQLVSILDDFIGRPTMALNGPQRGQGRGYGSIGDWREQNHGMEYRTPPSSIFRKPEFATITLKLAYNLATSLANNLELEYTPSFPSIEELISVGQLTLGEAEKYVSECEKLAPTSSECLLAAWEVEVKKSIPKILLSFQDSWNEEVKLLLQREINEYNLKVIKSMTLIFYGLHKKRGKVFTFEIPDKTIIKHPQNGLSPAHLGFPKYFRIGTGISMKDIEDTAKAIVKYIKTYLADELKEYEPEEDQKSIETETMPDSVQSCIDLMTDSSFIEALTSLHTSSSRTYGHSSQEEE